MAVKKKEKAFEREVDLCAEFIKALPPGWTSYAECCGHDILLVRHADGLQIGVQAKLRLGLEVVCQAMEKGYSYTVNGPDCRAILVPAGENWSWDKICRVLGITIIRMSDPRSRTSHGHYAGKWFVPELPEFKRDRSWEFDET